MLGTQYSFILFNWGFDWLNVSFPTGYEPSLKRSHQILKTHLLVPSCTKMSSSEFDLSKIPVLYGQVNYCKWSLGVKATAQLGGFWKAIIGDNMTISTDTSEIYRIEQCEQKALGLITKTVSDVLKMELNVLQVTDTNIMGNLKEPTVKEVWDHCQGHSTLSSQRALRVPD